MLFYEVFVGKLVAIDRERTFAITFSEIASLNHKVLNDAVKNGGFVAHRNMVDPVHIGRQY